MGTLFQLSLIASHLQHQVADLAVQLVYLTILVQN
jgi:hypothetical protein